LLLLRHALRLLLWLLPAGHARLLLVHGLLLLLWLLWLLLHVARLPLLLLGWVLLLACVTCRGTAGCVVASCSGGPACWG
jgi:hypothetical protein